MELLHGSRAAPEELLGVTAPWLPVTRAQRLPEPSHWAPSWGETAAAAVTIGGPTTVLILGRRGGPEFLGSELARLGHLVNLARAIRSGSD